MLPFEAEDLVETLREGIVVLAPDLTVRYANRAYFAMFATTERETLGFRLTDLGDGQWNIPALRTLLEDIIPNEAPVEAYKVEHEFPGVGLRVMELDARKVERPGNNAQQILLIIEDVTKAALHERATERERRLNEGIVATIREPLLVLDGDLSVIGASRNFYAAFRTDEANTLGYRLTELGNGQWDIPELTHLLETIIPDHMTVDDYGVEHTFPGIGHRTMLLNARKIFREGNNTRTFLLAFEDVTEQRRLDSERNRALERSEALLKELSHRVMNSLSIISSVVTLESRQLSDERDRTAFDRIAARIFAVAELYRTLSGTRSVDAVDAKVFLNAICTNVFGALQNDGGNVGLSVEIESFPISSDTAIPLGLILNELLTNAVKYAYPGDRSGEIKVEATRRDDEIVMSVADDGAGIDETARVDSGIGASLIDLFSRQLNGRTTRDSGAHGTTARLVFAAPAQPAAGG